MGGIEFSPIALRPLSRVRGHCLGVILLLGCVLAFDPRLARGQDPSTPPPNSTGGDELRDITGIEQAARAPARPWWPYTFGSAAVLMMSLFLVGWRYYRRSSDKTELHSGSWALAELERIESLARGAGQGQLERYPAMLSEMIRVYLDKRFQLRAPRQTTPEFFHDIKDSSLFNSGHRQLLKDFLERCDLAKFAHIQFTLEECRALAQSARKFVEETAE